MATPSTATSQAAAARHHAFHPLRIAEVVHETPDARSFVLEVPEELNAEFAYAAGQFCTFRIEVDGAYHPRCYSMSSSPAVDEALAVTVKRVPGGVVSNWMIDHLAPGDVVDVAPPTGFFQLVGGERDIAAFGGGSGITPVFALLKTAMATTQRRFHLLYANRDRESVIFDRELEVLLEEYGDRLTVEHHLDVEDGFVDAGAVQPFLEAAPDADFYICGPGPFMDIVEQTLLDNAVDPERIHIERFAAATPVEVVEAPEPTSASTATRVTIELDGRTESVDHRPGTTILQTARQMGMAPPFSCESGSCATCMARCVEGAVSMHVNNALTPEEVDAGWVLTCQSVPTTPTVHVIYGWDE